MNSSLRDRLLMQAVRDILFSATLVVMERGLGIWVADRGFDSLEQYEMSFSLPAPRVVRQRGDPTILPPNGTPTILRD